MALSFYFLRPIEPGDIVTGLSLDDEDYQALLVFLKDSAKPFQETAWAELTLSATTTRRP
jgi:hypothetical protein